MFLLVSKIPFHWSSPGPLSLVLLGPALYQSVSLFVSSHQFPGADTRKYAGVPTIFPVTPSVPETEFPSLLALEVAVVHSLRPSIPHFLRILVLICYQS